MPTEVAMKPIIHPFHKQSRESHSCINTETMSGNMILVNMSGRRQGVHVKVYRTSLEHFVVLYPQKKICRPLGVLNLRNTQLEPLPPNGFTLRQKGYDAPMALTFVSEQPKELDAWIVAFTPRGSPTLRHSALPVLEEDEEV